MQAHSIVDILRNIHTFEQAPQNPAIVPFETKKINCTPWGPVHFSTAPREILPRRGKVIALSPAGLQGVSPLRHDVLQRHKYIDQTRMSDDVFKYKGPNNSNVLYNSNTFCYSERNQTYNTRSSRW